MMKSGKPAALFHVTVGMGTGFCANQNVPWLHTPVKNSGGSGSAMVVQKKFSFICNILIALKANIFLH